MARPKKPRDQFYVDYVVRCWKQAEEAKQPRRKAWEEMWQLYQNKQDWSKKQSWQSKCFDPKIFMQVERSSGEVKRAIIQTRKLFKFEIDDQEDRERLTELEERRSLSRDGAEIAALEQAIQQLKIQMDNRERRMFVREAGFKRSLLQSNLTNVYSTSIKEAFLIGIGVTKVLWDFDHNRVKYEHPDAMNVAISPEYDLLSMERPPYIVERQEIDLAELRRRSREIEEYKSAEVKKIEEDMVDFEKRSKRRQRLGLGDYKPINKKVELLIFWGNVIRDDDKTIDENQLIIVANRKYVVRMHENPYIHGLPPYILTIPIIYPHRGTDGVSLIAPQVRLQYTLNNIINAYVDALNYSINPVYEYDSTNVQNPLGLTALYPGKKVPVKGNGQVIREIKTSPVSKEALEAIRLFKDVMDEGSGVTEFIAGQAGGKSKTLGEVELKLAQSRGLFDVMARDLEANSLTPLLEMTYDLYVQFADYEPRENNYTFSVGGLSLMLMQRELIDRVGQVLGLALKSPELAAQTDIPDLWKKFLSIYNLSDVYKEPDRTAEMATPQQLDAVQSKAEQDAKAAVANMPPDEIMRMAV